MMYDLEKIKSTIDKALSICTIDEKNELYDKLIELDDINLLSLLDNKQKQKFDNSLNNDNNGGYVLNTCISKLLLILESEKELTTIISFVKNYYISLSYTLTDNVNNVLLPPNIDKTLLHLKGLENGKNSFKNDTYYIMVGLIIYGYTKFNFKG